MIIDVKTTKSDGGKKEGVSRQLYLLKEARLSKVPYVFGAMLLGIAAYLKSAVPSWGGLPSEEGGPARPDEAGSPRLRLIDTGMMLEPLEPFDQGDAQPQEEVESRRIGSGTLFDHRLPSAEFMLIDSPPLNFVQPFIPKVDVSGSARFQGIFTVANDNVAPIGSGGSGGNTGGSKTPRTPPEDNVAKPGDDGKDDDTPSGKPPVDDKKPPIDDKKDQEKPPTVMNRAPKVNGPVYLLDVAGCAAVLIGLSDLLANAFDPDGDALSIRNLRVSSGTITQTGTGWLYDPNGLGPVTVTYEITDGKVSIIQHAFFSVVRKPPVVGTDGDDVLLGTECADTIEGRGGDDLIDGRAGDDLIDGGAGDDHIVGGAGNDILYGGEGNDVILGGDGDDQISGGAGDDRLFGDGGNDVVFGDAGNDQISGGKGNDALFGGDGRDIVSGDSGDDNIQGNSGDDNLKGGEGDDVIAGGAGCDVIDGGSGADLLLDDEGQDTVTGGEGNDHVVVALDAEGDVYDGGSGTDTLNLSAAEADLHIDLAQGTASGGDIGNNQVADFEIVRGGSGHDVIVGSNETEALVGGAGDDELVGAGGDDMLDGGHGQDSLDGGAGSDTLQGGAGNDLIADGEGNDSVSAGEGDDRVIVADDAADDAYDGGVGTDTLDLSNTGCDVDVDLAQGSASGSGIGSNEVDGFEIVIGGSGDDTMSGGEGDETLTGGAGDDELGGAGGNDMLDGGNGQDSLDGGAGDDTLQGGAGEDTIADGTGSDVVAGGAGNDTVCAEADGEDDVYNGGDGSDTLDYSSSEEGVTIDLTQGTASGADIGNDQVAGFETVIGGSADDHFIVGPQPVVLEGGEGDDLFEFITPPCTSASVPVLHEIVDFEVGDRIRMSKYDIFEKVFDALEDQFESIYGDKVDEDDARIRYRYEKSESIDRTVIEADLDRDKIYETTIHLDGRQVIVIVEHA